MSVTDSTGIRSAMSCIKYKDHVLLILKDRIHCGCSLHIRFICDLGFDAFAGRRCLSKTADRHSDLGPKDCCRKHRGNMSFHLRSFY